MVVYLNVANATEGGSSGVEMRTPSHNLRPEAGESIELGCEFQAWMFNLFDNPVLWRKTQRHEETQINMMGNLLEPFVSAKRFRVSFDSRDGVHTLWLFIRGQILSETRVKVSRDD